MENQNFELDKLIKETRFVRDWSRNPIYDVIFSFDREYLDHLQAKDFKISRFHRINAIQKISKVDMTFWCKQNSDGLKIRYLYTNLTQPR